MTDIATAAGQSAPEDRRGPRPFIVESRRKESEVITSFVLRPADGGAPAPHEAGQHLTLFADISGHGRQKRNFTISSAPNGETYRITVKREPAGTVTGWLHDSTGPGTRLDIARPDGNFVLPRGNERPIVMLSAGVGLTPMVAMLEEIVREKRPARVQFIHCTRNSGTHALGGQVRALADASDGIETTFFYTQPESGDVPGRDFDISGHLSLDWLAAHTPIDEAEYFVCGPLRFLWDFVPGLAQRGVPTNRLHYEFFGPVEDLFGEATGGGTVPAPQSGAVAARRARAVHGFSREQIGDALVDSAADAIVASATDGTIVLWNAGAERIFGFTEEEALGQSLDIIIPEPFRARHWEGYDETVASGVSRYGAGDLLAVPGLHKDRRRISIEFTIVLLKDAGGTVTGMVAGLRDVTARFEETKALKKKLAALEAATTSAGS